MFKSNPVWRSNGFHMEFANGCTLSVQWGEFSYCARRSDESLGANSPNAEVAAWDANGEWITRGYFRNEDDVAGWQTPDEVLAFAAWVAAYPGK